MSHCLKPRRQVLSRHGPKLVKCAVIYLSEVVLCENGYDTFTCDAETNETMRIIYANYGRLSLDICVPEPPSTATLEYPYNVTDCRAANSTEILQAKCDGRVSCEFHAAASKFGGDPCPYIHRYLEVTYACIQPGRYRIFLFV